jgi:hypothetical protein
LPGIDSLMSVRLVMSNSEKIIPEIAAARGVRNV